MATAFCDLPEAKSCRLIDFSKAEVRPGFVNDTYVLIVSGVKPYVNMNVVLSPLVYITQPDYWGIEVVGYLPGIGLPAEAQYSAHIPLDGIRGKKGIEVIGASKCEKIEVGGADKEDLGLSALLNLKEDPPLLTVKGSIMVYRDDDVVNVNKVRTEGPGGDTVVLELTVTEGTKPLKGQLRDFSFSERGDYVAKYRFVSATHIDGGTQKVAIRVFG